MTGLSFWTKFTQKRYSQSKTEQPVQELQTFVFYLVKIHSTVACCFWTFSRSQKSHYFEHFEREIGYLLPPGLFLS